MTSDIKKTIIAALCLVVVVALTVGAAFKNVDAKVFKVLSVKSLLAKREEILEEKQKLSDKKQTYEASTKKVETAKTTFDQEKAKYESISDETINIIKEATTEENYDIEYMWITLANYASKNILDIVMVEPGGSDNGTSTTTTNTNTTTTVTASDSNTATVSTGNINQNASQDFTSGSAASSTVTSGTTLFKVQVTGSYLNVSDFIFDVENDKTLRFKLDNISMTPGSGTDITASFNVKNIAINLE